MHSSIPNAPAGTISPELAALLAAGGATLVQLRDKHGETRAMVEEARAIRRASRRLRVPLLINDRVDVALAAGADGVHVGQDDMAVEDARRLLGPDAIIGLSIKTVAQAEAAPVDLLDYVGIGGVYATTSKDNPDPPIGVAGLRAHRRRVSPARVRICRSAPSPASMPSNAGADHRGRRRRRRGDLGAVARREPARRRARHCARSSMRRSRERRR